MCLGLWALWAASTAVSFAQDQDGQAKLRVARLPATVDSIQAARDSQQWQPAEPRLLREGRNGGAQWWKLELETADAGEEWILSLQETFDSTVVAHLPPDYRPQRLNVFDPQLRQPGSRHRLAIALDASQRAAPAYLRVEWRRSQPITLRAQPRDVYLEADLQRVRFSSMVLAVSLLMAVVGVVFALALHRRLLLLLCLWIVSLFVYQAVMSGEIVWMMPPTLHAADVMVIGSMAAHLGLLASYVFVYGFLRVQENFPRLARLFRGLLWAVGLLALLSLLTAAHSALSQPLNLVLLMLAGLALGMAVRLAIRGDVQARFYVFGWGLVAVAGLLRAGHFLSLQGTPEWLEFAHPAMNAVGALVLVLATARAARYAEREMHSARISARTDPLTGLPNRAELDSSLPARIEAARAAARPLCLLFIDLDHFKRINDRFGHDVGDLCLIAAARILRRHVRASDLLARYGGEEFVLLLEGADLGAARSLAAELRASIEREGRSVGEQAVGMTVSLGIAELVAEDDFGSLLRRADAALYRAKGEGRNCYVSDPPMQAA
jgi:diguanylate cyclase (GGDEF)-like protein